MFIWYFSQISFFELSGLSPIQSVSEKHDFQIYLQERLFTHFVAKTFPQNWRLKGFHSDKDCLEGNPKKCIVNYWGEGAQKGENYADSFLHKEIKSFLRALQ